MRCFGYIQQLPFVSSQSRGTPTSIEDERWIITTQDSTYELSIEHKRGHLGAATIQRLLSLRERTGLNVLLCAPMIWEPMMEQLRSHALNYCDEAGNLYIDLDGHYMAWITGKTSEPKPIQTIQGLRRAGSRVLGALLSEPTLLRQPLRQVASEVGVSHVTVSKTKRILEAAGDLVTTRDGPKLIRTTRLLDQWVQAYATMIRPKLLLGTYRFPGDRQALRQVLDKTMKNNWAWGGAFGLAMRYGWGSEGDSIVHLKTIDATLQHPIPLLPDPSGSIVVLGLPFSASWGDRIQGSVDPLLLYAELRQHSDDRMQEVAQKAREHLLHFWEVE